MKISTFAVIVAVICLIYGIALLFFPAQFLQNFETTLDARTTVLARQYGIAFCGFSVLYWMNRNIPGSEKSWAALLWSNLFFNIANLIVFFKAIADGLATSFAWSSVILSAVFAIWSLYFLFRKK